MVRVVHCPSFARTAFTPNELSGWPDGVAFSPRKGFRRSRSELRKRLLRLIERPAVSVKPISFGKDV